MTQEPSDPTGFFYQALVKLGNDRFRTMRWFNTKVNDVSPFDLFIKDDYESLRKAIDNIGKQ